MAKAIKFTTGELNLMKEFGLDPTKYDEPKVTERSNPFSGVSVPLNTFEAKLYDLTIKMIMAYESGDPNFKVGKYDRLKYLLLKINPQAYMDLID